MSGKKHWSAEELEILKKNYETNSIKKMQELLPDRSKDAIQWKANQLGFIIRNGKKISANKKIIVNVTEEHYRLLKSKTNQSRIIREALDLYLKKQ